MGVSKCLVSGTPLMVITMLYKCYSTIISSILFLLTCTLQSMFNFCMEVDDSEMKNPHINSLVDVAVVDNEE